MRGAITLALILTAACSHSAGVDASPAVAPKLASTAEWANEGARLRQAKLDNPYPTAATGATGASEDWAYASQPVLIDRPGNYTLRFGPLTPNFSWPTSPSGEAMGVSFSWPIDKEFRVSSTGRMGIVTIGGERWFEAEFTVTDFRTAYPGFYGWLF